MDELDDYGRPPAVGWAILGRAGPIIPPPPKRQRAAGWPSLLRRILHDSPTCWGCDRPAETGHHIVPVGVDATKELEEDNIVPVCVPCHYVICHLGRWTLYNPDIVADLARYLADVRTARPIKAGETT